MKFLLTAVFISSSVKVLLLLSRAGLHAFSVSRSLTSSLRESVTCIALGLPVLLPVFPCWLLRLGSGPRCDNDLWNGGIKISGWRLIVNVRASNGALVLLLSFSTTSKSGKFSGFFLHFGLFWRPIKKSLSYIFFPAVFIGDHWSVTRI